MATIDLGEARNITDSTEKKYNLPSGSLYKVAGIESSFNGAAVSPKGAKGFFGFMDPTAKHYGAVVGDFTSEADAAGRYLQDNLKKFNGDMDKSLADYNGGPKAVAALSKGKPWPETTDYLTKFGGTGTTPSQRPVSPQFSAGGSAAPSYPPSGGTLDREERATAREHGGLFNSVGDIPKAIGIGIDLDNSVTNWIKNKYIEEITPDFQRSKEYGAELLNGIPPEHWPYILQGQSANEDQARLGRVKTAMEQEKELGKMGGIGIMGRMGANILDVQTLTAFVPGTLGAGLLSKGSRLMNAAKGGFIGGASNGLYEAAVYDQRPLGTATDVYMATVLGTALGAIGGGFHKGGVLADENKSIEQWAHNEFKAAQKAEFDAAGEKLTPAGEEFFKKTHSDETLNAAGVTRGPYNESSLKGVGSDPTRSKLNIMGDSTDIPETTFAELRALKAAPATDTTHIDVARASLTKAFGSDILDGLEGSGRIKFINSQADLPASLRNAKGVNAFYDHLTDTTFLMADRLNPENIRGIIMHDVGVHQGLERVVGTDIYKRMIKAVDDLAAAGDAQAVSALEKASKSRTKDFLKGEEKLAYYMEHVGDKAPTIFREALANVKAFLIKRLGVDIELNSKDLIALVQGSVRKVAKDKEFGSHNANFPYVWSGGPVKGIDKFSTDFVGKGEGNVNQGWGLYTSSSKHVGNWYREKESALRGMKAEDGGLYQLKVNNVRPEEFLRWETTSQSREVQKALKEAGIDFHGKTGKEIYFSLMEKVDGETPLARAKAASELLDSVGVRGNVYNTGASRNSKVKSSNHVFFSDRHLEVSLRFSEGEGALVGAKGVDPVLVKAANDAQLSPVFGHSLALEHRTQGEGVAQATRAEAGMLIGTTVGYKDHSVVKAHANGQMLALADSSAVKFRKEAYPAFEEWFKESGRSSWEKGKAFDEFGEQMSDYIRGVDAEYPKQVIKAGEAAITAHADMLEHVNNPGKYYGAKTLGLTETILKDVETGKETIVGTLPANRNYLSRKTDINKMNAMDGEFGQEAIEGFYAGAYRSARPEISAEAAKKWSGWYVKTIVTAQSHRDQDLVGNMLQGMDRGSLKESLMRNGGYTDIEALKVIDDMFPTHARDTGAIQASLKHRNTIDERYTETWTKKDGTTAEISLKNFTEANAFTLVEGYLRRTSGSVALAHHMGVYKTSDISQRILSATENPLGPNRLKDAALKRNRDDLQFIYDRIQGLPQEDFSGLNKAMEMWRSFNVIRLMSGAVFNQVTEMSQIVGSMGWKAMMEAMPELESLSRNIASGRAPHDILEHLENTIGGAGSDFVKRMDFKNSDDWVRNVGDTAWNRRLDKLDTGLKKMAKGTLDYTGMTPLMVLQKRVHAIALVNHFINDATGSRASTFLSKDRLAWMGLSTEDFASVQKSLKEYSSPTKGEYSATHKVDFDKWVNEDPATHAQFMEAVRRESNRVVQENDLASMIPIMGTTLGQTMFQFMNFSLHGWNKSMLFAMHHRDYSTLSTVMQGGLLGSLAYMGRTHLASLGMDEASKQEFMDKRMSTKQIVANSIGKTAQASLLPTLYDSTLGNLTGPMFSGARTTSDISSIASNPTIGAINSTLSLMKIGKNAVSSESQTTQSDMKSWGKLLPLNNMVPISTLLNSIANDFPKSATQE